MINFAEAGTPPWAMPIDLITRLCPGTAIAAESGDAAGAASNHAFSSTPNARFAAC